MNMCMRKLLCDWLNDEVVRLAKTNDDLSASSGYQGQEIRSNALAMREIAETIFKIRTDEPLYSGQK